MGLVVVCFVLSMTGGGCGNGPKGPVIDSLSAHQGPLSGGTLVRIEGSGLAGAQEVLFGSRNATLLSVEAAELQVATPHHTPGSVLVRVRFEDGTTRDVPERFTFNGGEGPGSFFDATSELLPRETLATQDAAVGDFDGDGRTDIFLPGYFGDPSLLLLRADRGFEAVTGECAPTTNGVSVHAEAGDVDADGDLDLVVVNEDAHNQLFLNDGSGCLRDVTDIALPEDSGYGEGGDLGDVDGDGDLDLVVSNLRTGEQNRLLLNLGDGRFVDATHASLPQVEDASYSTEFADLDDDDDLDLIVANYGEKNRIYANDGAGRFTEVTDALADDDALSTVLLPGDVDGDGCPELFEAVFRGPDRLWRNDCTGRFSPAGSAALEAVSDDSYDVEWFDLEGDGDLDLAVAVTGAQSRLYKNESGTLVDVTRDLLPTEADHHYAVEVLDADDDGALDLLLTSWKGEGTVLYRNTNAVPEGPALARVSPPEGDIGGGLSVALRGVDIGTAVAARFGDHEARTLTVEDETWVQAVTPAGMAGTVAVTLVLASGVELTLGDGFTYLESADMVFVDRTSSKLPAESFKSTGLVAVDLDADGDVDLAVSDEETGLRLLLNDGSGVFSDATSVLAPGASGAGQDVMAADLNGDDAVELVLSLGSNAALGWNDGTGALELAMLGVPANTADAGDVNGDGIVDLVFGVAGPDVLMLGVGARGFARDATFPSDDGDTRKVVLTDFDADEALDLLAVDFQGIDRIYMNDGTGLFVALDEPLADNPSLQSYGGAAADVDDDGDIDVLIAQGGATGQNLLYLNDGSASFSLAPERLPMVALGSSSALFTDLDADGDLDVVIANFWGTNEVYENVDGTLEAVSWLPESPGNAVGVAAADFDANGRVDLYFAVYAGQDRLYLAR